MPCQAALQDLTGIDQQIDQQIDTIGDLVRLRRPEAPRGAPRAAPAAARQRQRGRVATSIATNATQETDLRRLPHPERKGDLRALWEPINDAPLLPIDEHRAVATATPDGAPDGAPEGASEGAVVDAQDCDRRLRWLGIRHDELYDRLRGDGQTP